MSAAPDRQPPVKGPGGGTPPGKDETDLWMLVSEYGAKPRHAAALMGMHPRRLEYLCRKWARQGRYTWGVVHDLGWPVTPRQEGSTLPGWKQLGHATDSAELVELVASWFDVDPSLLAPPRAPDLTEVHRVAAKAAKQVFVRTVAEQAAERVKAAMMPASRAHVVYGQHARRTPEMQAFMDLPAPTTARGGIRYPSAHYTVHMDGTYDDHTVELTRRMQRSNRG